MPEAKKQTILLVEDTPSQSEIYASYLRIAGYQVEQADTAQKAITFLRQSKPDAVVLDLGLPDMPGEVVLQDSLLLYPSVPVIVVTADTASDTAVKAMESGAYDFITKPFPAPRLVVTLNKAVQHSHLVGEVSAWRTMLGQATYHGFVGQSPQMQAVYRVIESVAASRATVFIMGESGTGKELAASALHQASPRREKPFVAMNCGAIPVNLLESHLFGHIKGAFTGAVSTAEGAATKADGGTLFLDEICEMPLELQVKLLRFLQTGDVTSVGSQEVRHVDIRVVAATNRDPLAEVKQGRFREDLYYRLHVVPLELPRLCEREDDVMLLAHHFLEKYNQAEGKGFNDFTPEVTRLFRRFEWPGNVRQLENTIHSIIAQNNGPLIERAMLDDNFTAIKRDVLEDGTPSGTLAIRPLWLVEKTAILTALQHTDQDVVKAAALLDVSPSTLYRKLQAWRKEDES